MQEFEHKKASSFLDGENHDLRFLFTKIKRLEALNQKIATYLDPVWRKYVHVGNCVGTRLILIAANASIATQLRYQSDALIRQFQSDDALQHIKEIECKVRPATPSPLHTRLSSATQQPPLPPLSPQTASIIHEIADGIKDEKVKAILHRIASRVKKKDV